MYVLVKARLASMSELKETYTLDDMLYMKWNLMLKEGVRLNWKGSDDG